MNDKLCTASIVIPSSSFFNLLDLGNHLIYFRLNEENYFKEDMKLSNALKGATRSFKLVASS